MISLTINGRFRMSDSRGADLAPRGMKSRALIALLAVSPDQRRTRSWLQSKLWSTRSSEQASGSLRQTLSEIRRSLGEHSELLLTNGPNVSLDSNMLKIEHDDTQNSTLFDDIEVNDPAFVEWLDEIRAKEEPTPVTIISSESDVERLGRPILIIDTPAKTLGLVEHAANEFVKSTIVSMIIEATDINVVDISSHDGNVDHQPTKAQDGLYLNVFTTCANSTCTSHIQLSSLSQRKMLWTDMCQSMSLAAPYQNEILPDLRRLISHLISNIYRAIPKLLNDKSSLQFFAPFLFHKAQKNIFSLKKENLIRAEKLLDMAFTNQQSGMYLAWKAYLKNIAQFQFPHDTFHSQMHDQITLLDEAFELSPNNSFINAILAQHEYIDNNNMIAANALAQRSIEYNPSNPFSWAILANAQLAASDFDKSQSSVNVANDLAKHSEYQFFIDFFTCMVSAGSGDYMKAIYHAELARTSNREFVAPLRYLIPLYKHEGKIDNYHRAIKELTRLEPSFEISKYSDPEYPVNTLRKIPLIDSVT